MVQVACGIDIGGSGVKGALVDLETGEYIGDQIRIPTPNPATPEAVATVCREVIDQLDVKIGVPIGVTFPAPVFNGVIPYMANLDQSWVNVDVDTLMERHLGRAVVALNDADAAGIDVARVIEACNSQPYSHIHRPGIAVGGHCIPVYPRLYLAGDPGATVVSAARAANADMPAYAVSRAAALLGSLEGLRVAVLGAAYRGGVKETAFSGVFGVVSALNEAGAKVSVHDPLYSDSELAAFGWDAYQLGEEVDVAIIQADHASYRDLAPANLPGVRLLVDGRAITSPEAWAGTPRITIGGGASPAC